MWECCANAATKANPLFVEETCERALLAMSSKTCSNLVARGRIAVIDVVRAA